MTIPIVALGSQGLQVSREGLGCMGIGTVAYSPLGRGFLTGRFSSPADFQQGDFRSVNPRFAREAFESDMAIVDVVKDIAAAKGVTPAQVALAWVYSRGDDVVAIPGTRRPARLEENVGALDVTLTDEDLQRLEPLSELVVGARY
jgi:aryl-alcohol dehydrogenase-like predicted oxidoreductase